MNKELKHLEREGTIQCLQLILHEFQESVKKLSLKTFTYTKIHHKQNTKTVLQRNCHAFSIYWLLNNQFNMQVSDIQNKGLCRLPCVISLRFGNLKSAGQGETERREREQGTQWR